MPNSGCRSEYNSYSFQSNLILNHLSFVQGLAMATVRFRFDGQAINETDTPSSLEMEEGDTIEVYQQQTGGKLA